MPRKAINKPNFFILGAGKSGTTTLYHYLKQHPSVFMTANKEPTFFCEGNHPPFAARNPIEYFELFDAVGNETVIGEASQVYLSNPATSRVLKGLFPDAKFLVILRNPADRAYSLYHHMRRQGWEQSSTFEHALRLEEERATSPRFRRKCTHNLYNYLYFRSGLFGEQLQRYFSFFDRKQFYILTLAQLKSDAPNALRGIFEFLEIDAEFKPALGVHNEGKVTARIPWLHYFWNTKISSPRPLRRLILKILHTWDMMPIPPMRQETRKELLTRYESDLELLYSLTGIRFPISE